jgi:hypothetical protein
LNLIHWCVYLHLNEFVSRFLSHYLWVFLFFLVYLSICLFLLSSFVSVVGGKYLMSFVSVYVCVSSITLAHTHTQFQFFFFFFSFSFLRVELLALVRRTGVLASYHLCKCVCVRFFLSKHSFFIRTYCNFGHTYLYIYIEPMGWKRTR